MLPSICFLDIRMPGCCGLDVAQALAEEWPEDASFPLLVFVTAYDEYAVRAFERQAVDHLLKPIEPARLAECCRRLRERLAERGRARPRSPDSGAADQHAEALARAVEQLRGLLGATLDAGSANAAHAGHAADAGEAASADGPLRLIQAQRGQTLHLVPVDEVVYFEAADKYVRVVTPEHEWLIRTPLRELLERLDTEAFWQIHRATVVQARQVESVQRDARGRLTVRLRSRPELLPVSRLYASRFRPLRSFGPGPRHRTRE